jgi:hypothetical protein
MVLGFGRIKSQTSPPVPWSSIDPAEGQGDATTWEPENTGEWFLKTPPGDWKMDAETAPTAIEAEQDESDNLAAPFETLPQEVEEEEPYPPRMAAETGAWTIAFLCMGLGLIAACLIIPQADANRRLVYEREQLRMELMQTQKQTALNRDFLSKMESDPQLTERLAQREMHAVEQGQAVVNLNDGVAADGSMSPYTLVNVPPPPPLAPYHPVGGVLASLCLNPDSRVYVLGFGMFCVAGGLVLGGPAKMKNPIEPLEPDPDEE